jgi:hypothetical protein
MVTPVNKSTARPHFDTAMLAVPGVRLCFSCRTEAARYDFFTSVWSLKVAKSQINVIPAQAGIQWRLLGWWDTKPLDSRLRGNDSKNLVHVAGSFVQVEEMSYA